jgi:glycogen(starch) synthase
VRVLMLSWDFPPRASGGTAAHVDGLSRALGAGHDVIVLTVAERRTDGGTIAAEQRGPVRVLRTDVGLPWLTTVDQLARTASANHAITKVGATLPRHLDGWRPDVLHAHDWRVGWAADTLATLYDVPFVLSMHGTERVRHGGHLPPGPPIDISAVEWWLAFRADRLISSTRFMVEQLLTGFELDPDRIVRIPNGIDLAAWAPSEPPPDRRPPHVVSWGRVQYEKGFQVLARAIQQLRGRVPDLRCTIAGRGSYLPELQTQIDVEGVSDLVDLPGYLTDPVLRRLAQRAGCIAIPSLYEPFGVVALEALAAGAPLIVADTGGLAELVDGTGAALTFEPGNTDDLARCIERALTDPAVAARLTREARDLVVRRFAWEAIAATTAEVYEEAVAAH